MTVLKGIIQLRPCLRHIERLNESGRQTGGGGGVVSDGDTTATESEEEEAKPITVCFLSLLSFLYALCNDFSLYR